MPVATSLEHTAKALTCPRVRYLSHGRPASAASLCHFGSRGNFSWTCSQGHGMPACTLPKPWQASLGGQLRPFWWQWMYLCPFMLFNLYNLYVRQSPQVFGSCISAALRNALNSMLFPTICSRQYQFPTIWNVYWFKIYITKLDNQVLEWNFINWRH